MEQDTLVLLGDLSARHLSLDSLAAEFGWSIERVPNIGSLRRLGTEQGLVAVLIEAAGLGVPWQQALRSVHEAAPQALVIPCRRFSDRTPWMDLAAAGAFHELRLPFDPHELRQGLGFVWAVQHRGPEIASARPRPMHSRQLAS